MRGVRAGVMTAAPVSLPHTLTLTRTHTHTLHTLLLMIYDLRCSSLFTVQFCWEDNTAEHPEKQACNVKHQLGCCYSYMQHFPLEFLCLNNHPWHWRGRDRFYSDSPVSNACRYLITFMLLDKKDITQKLKLSLFNHHHVVPNISSAEHK